MVLSWIHSTKKDTLRSKKLSSHYNVRSLKNVAQKSMETEQIERKIIKKLPLYNHSGIPRGKITGVKIGLMDAEIFRRQMMVEVNDPTAYDKTIPKDHGLFSRLMGSVSYEHNCLTCSSDCEDDVGHFGGIILSMPIYSFKAITKIEQTLTNVCPNCNRCLIQPHHSAYAGLMAIKNPTKRAKAVSEIAMKMEYCGGPPIPGEKFDAEAFLLNKRSGCHAKQPIWKIYKT